MTNNVISFIVAHPLDEALGAGGLIKKLSDMGWSVNVLSLTGEDSYFTNIIEEVSKEIGVKEYSITDVLPFEITENLIPKIIKFIMNTKPEVVVTHVPFDYHSDHVKTYNLVKDSIEWAARTDISNKSWRVNKLLLMEIDTLISKPNLFVDISDVIDLKINTICEYYKRLKKTDRFYKEFTRIKARLRGLQFNTTYAEAFIAKFIDISGPYYDKERVKSILNDIFHIGENI